MAKNSKENCRADAPEADIVLVRRSRRGCGCFSTLLLILVVFLCGYLWHDREQLYKDGQFHPEVLRESLGGLKFWSGSTAEYLDPLRRQIDQMLTRTKDMKESGELADRLSDLRTTLDSYKDKASEVSVEMWTNLEEKTSGLIDAAKESKAAEKSEEMIGDLEKLQETIRHLKAAEENLKALDADQTTEKEHQTE